MVGVLRCYPFTASKCFCFETESLYIALASPDWP